MCTVGKKTRWQKAIRTIILAGFFVSASANAQNSAHHAYYKLYKPYRTYLRIAEYLPAKHNFWIAFEVNENVTILNDFSMTMRADSVDEAGRAEPMFVVREFDPAQQQGQSVPIDLQPIVDALQDRLRVLYPNRILSGSFRAGYFGRHYNIVVSEEVPDRRFDEIPVQGEIHFSNRNFDARVSENADSIEWVEAHRNDWHPMNCPTRSCSEEPLLVNFAMPDSLEGTLPLTAHIVQNATTNPAYLLDYPRLRQSILQTVRELSRGSYVNPIHEILANQESSYLPQQSLQQMQFAFTSVLVSNSTNSGESFEFPFEAETVLSGPISKTFYIEDGNAKIAVTFDTALASVKIEHVYLPTGETGERVLPLARDWIADGQRHYIRPFAGISGGSNIIYFNTSLADGRILSTYFPNAVAPRKTYN